MQGEKRILIQLPGVTDTQRAKELIGKTALLEFKLLDESRDPETAVAEGAPPGTEILYEIREDAQTRRVIKRPYLVD
jgi:preprotein translocase subunit SecD